MTSLAVFAADSQMGASHSGFGLDPGFVGPAYDDRSFVALPRSIAGLLGRAPKTPLGEMLSSSFGGDFDRIVLLLADGFGWRFFERYSDYPVLRRFAQEVEIPMLALVV